MSIGAILVAAIIIGLLPAIIAAIRGHRNFLQWWAFGAFLFPVALVESFLAPPGGYGRRRELGGTPSQSGGHNDPDHR